MSFQRSSRCYQGLPGGYQGVYWDFLWVPGGFQGVSDGYYVSGYDILKNTPDLLTYLLTKRNLEMLLHLKMSS